MCRHCGAINIILSQEGYLNLLNENLQIFIVAQVVTVAQFSASITVSNDTMRDLKDVEEDCGS